MHSQPLWTRDFIIITIGTAISTLGNAIAGFAISLLVLDHTGSTLLYALFMACYYLPKVVTPLVVGPWLDRTSRKKVIYRLDFLSSFLYLLVFVLISNGFFHYWVLLAGVLVIGSIDGTYTVAYDSFYPNLVAPGNFARAYSIASLLYPLATFMLPVASIVYNVTGTVAPLFGFNAATFFAAACFERSIRYQETHMQQREQSNALRGLSRFRADFKEGMGYIKGEPGLLVVTVYFFVTMMTGQGNDALMLPFFRNHPHLFTDIPVDVVTLYSVVTVCGVAGRLVGGLIHYRFVYPTEKKFAIALFVYTAITVLHAGQLFLPVPIMMVSFFMVGLLSVTSYNIRISATQAYVPDSVRARFNGAFQMMCNLGQICGQVAAGLLSECAGERTIIIGLMAVNMVAIYAIVWPGRDYVKQVYNRRV